MLDYLFEYCNTPRQIEILKAVISEGSNRKAAKKLNCSNRGGVVEYFRTLAARQGYRAGRDMCLIVHHKKHGEIERHRCDIGMLT